MLDVRVILNERSVSVAATFSGSFEKWDIKASILTFGKYFRVCYVGSPIVIIDRNNNGVLFDEIKDNESLFKQFSDEKFVFFVNQSVLEYYRDAIKKAGGVILHEMLAEDGSFVFPKFRFWDLEDKLLCEYLCWSIRQRSMYVIFIVAIVVLSNLFLLSYLRVSYKSLSSSLMNAKYKQEYIEKKEMTEAILKSIRQKQVKYPISYMVDCMAIKTGNETKYNSIQIDETKIILSGCFSRSDSLGAMLSSIKAEDFVHKIEISEIEHIEGSLTQFHSTIWLK